MKRLTAPLLLPLLAALVIPQALAETTPKKTADSTPQCAPPGPPPDGKGPPPDGKNPPTDANGKPLPPPPGGKPPADGKPPEDGKGPPPCPPPDGKGPPPGAPPMAGGNGAPPGPPPGGHSDYTLSGAYTVAQAISAPERGKRYSAVAGDVSAIYVKHGGELHLIDVTISKSGDSSSHENSSFYGLNAAVLVSGGGVATLQNTRIDANGEGANAISVVGQGSRADVGNTHIVAHGNGAHGVDVAGGGTLSLHDVDIETFDASGAAIATDRGGGTITVEGGRYVAHGFRSPGLYSTGDISVAGAEVLATGAEAAVIEGSNRIEISNSHVVAGTSWGAMLYQSFSGDAQGQHAHFSQRGGSFEAHQGPLFYVTNATGEIELDNVALKADSGVLVKAAADRWGVKGRNAGHALVRTRHQTLTGDLVVADGGSIELALNEASTLHGRSQGASLSIDASSRWELTGDSSVVSLTLAGATPQAKLAHIDSHSHDIAYDAHAKANAWLSGKRWPLPGGGHLQPAG